MKHLINIVLLIFPFLSKAADFSQIKEKEPAPSLRLKIKLGSGSSRDTLIVHFFSMYFPIEDSLPVKDKYLILRKDGFYHISIHSKSEFGYFCLTRKNNPAYYGEVGFADTWLTKFYYWEAGDDITINLKLMAQDSLLPAEKRSKYLVQFSGKGSEKYRIGVIAQNELARTHFNVHNTCDSIGIFHHFQGLGRIRACQTLDRNRWKMSKSAYYVLKADILFGSSAYYFGGIKKYYWNSVLKKGEKEKICFRLSFDSVFQSSYRNCHIPDIYLARSRYFSGYYLGGIETKRLLGMDTIPGKELYNLVSQDSLYFEIKNNYVGVLRDKLLSYVISNTSYYKASNYPLLLSDALQSVKTQLYRDLVLKMYSARCVGKGIYNFSFVDSSGKVVTLSDFKGKTVFIDFYFNGCGACGSYYDNVLKPVEKALEANKSIVFLSISADVNINWFKLGLKSGKYGGSRSISLFTNGNGASDPIIKYYKITSFPTAILIGSDGKILEYNSQILYNENRLIKRLTQVSEGAELSRL